MGGLCGVVRLDGGPVGEGDLAAMCGAVAFRGPDGIGTWVDGPTGLGELALCVHPEDQGPGPYVAPEGDLVVVADARIDNRRELSGDLGLERSAPVATLVTAAYRKWGTAFPRHLLGDFAIGVWDRRRKHAVLARDPMALRAMYYRYEPGRRLLFGTEVGQLLALDGVAAGIDEQAVLRFLLQDPDPLHASFHSGVAQLAPGWVLVLHERGVQHWPFWQPDPDRRLRLRHEEEYAEALAELLMASVEARCRSSAPVGLMLSGGVDSGSIAAAAGDLFARGDISAIRAYNFQSADHPQMDERHVSSVLTEHFGLPSVPVSIDGRPPLSGWPHLAPHLDDPFHGEFSEIIDSVLSVAQGDGCRLVLSADRGDMVNGGMEISYSSMLRRLRLRTVLGGLSDQLRYTDDAWHDILRRDLLRPVAKGAWRRIAGTADGAGRDVDVAGVDARQLVPKRPAPQATATGDPGLRRRLGRYRSLRLELLLATSVTRNIIWSERLHARRGVGFADPWSDLRLAEFALAVPQPVLNHPGRPGKHLARRSMASLAPAGYQPVKTSAMSMFRAGVCGSPVIAELLAEPLAEEAGWVNAAEARRQHHLFCEGKVRGYTCWTALCLEMWLRRHWRRAAQG